MKVKISWRDCKTAGYLNIHDCPLHRALRKAGVPVDIVSGSAVFMRTPKGQDDEWYRFDSTKWNKTTQEKVARSHRAYYLEIPQLERAGRIGCND
jgi:hypothetical protein